MANLIERDNSGHRKRVAERFNSDFRKYAQDYELLEYLLFKIIPRKDTKPIAKELLTTFGSISGIMSASKEKLMTVKGIGSEVANYLLVITEFARRGETNTLKSFKLGNEKAALDYIYGLFTYTSEEKLYMLCLASDFSVICKISVDGDNASNVSFDPNDLCRKALSVGASYVIFTHNHLDYEGDLEPSVDDIMMTKNMIEKMDSINIVVADHIIVNAAKEVFSFKGAHLLADIYEKVGIPTKELTSISGKYICIKNSKSHYSRNILEAFLSSAKKL